jgi:5'-nucleotidase
MAPGIAALATMAAKTGHQVTIAAPLYDHSGSSAAVGPVYERTNVDFTKFELAGLDNVPAYGLDASPALSVMLCCLGAFGPMPDLVLSGINHGANTGRAILHSGTVGAALTAAHFHISAIAVSIKYGPNPIPWETPSTIAEYLISKIMEAPRGTVLNLNTPNVPLDELKGIAWGTIGRSGLIQSASANHTPGAPATANSPAGNQAYSEQLEDASKHSDPPVSLGTDLAGTLPKLSITSTDLPLPASLPDHLRHHSSGSIVLDLQQGKADLPGQVAGLGSSVQSDSAGNNDLTMKPNKSLSDIMLISQGYASITPLVATHESKDELTGRFVEEAIMSMKDLRF